MTTPDRLLTEAAISAAARALYLNSPINAGHITDREGIWDRMPETTKDAHRRQAEAAITAALEADR